MQYFLIWFDIVFKVTCITIAMASATRANSILNCGHVVYNSLKIVATEMILYVRMKKAKAKAELSTTIANILGDAIIPGLFNLVGCVGSFIVFQYFCFTNFCRVKRREKSDVADFVIDYGRRELLKVCNIISENRSGNACRWLGILLLLGATMSLLLPTATYKR